MYGTIRGRGLFILKATAILQGRVGSTRLPGKVLLPLVGKPTIQHVYQRTLYCKQIDRIIVATTTNPKDDPIAQLFERLGVEVFRGIEDDPLERFYQSASFYKLQHIVRIMSDCPLMDPEIVDEVIEGYFEGNYDYFYLAGGFPTGLDTTVFSYDALKKSCKAAQQRYEREHVTPYMSNHPELFKVGQLEKFHGLQHHRWVMDFPQDYEFIKQVYEALYEDGKLFVSRDILKFVEDNPNLKGSLGKAIPML